MHKLHLGFIVVLLKVYSEPMQTGLKIDYNRLKTKSWLNTHKEESKDGWIVHASVANMSSTPSIPKYLFFLKISTSDYIRSKMSESTLKYVYIHPYVVVHLKFIKGQIFRNGGEGVDGRSIRAPVRAMTLPSVYCDRRGHAKEINRWEAAICDGGQERWCGGCFWWPMQACGVAMCLCFMMGRGRGWISRIVGSLAPGRAVSSTSINPASVKPQYKA